MEGYQSDSSEQLGDFGAPVVGAFAKAAREEIYRDDFELDRVLPEKLRSLDRISKNFAWSWLPGGLNVFRDIDTAAWELYEQNPRMVLKKATNMRLCQLAANEAYLERLKAFEATFDEYVSTKNQRPRIAYFCAEFGVHNSLPAYSGGLGILAGDHLKSASDLNLPFAAVGLLYRFGYFRQTIGHDGWQQERYQDVFKGELALTPVVDEGGERVRISVHIRGNEVHAQAWVASVGRISLYLLDSNLPENDEVDRLITGHLYGGTTETRIVQEKLLGIGGVRLLRKLGFQPEVFHLNEGHSAFLTLELASEHIKEHPEASFDEARAAIREKCVFTTHTPVDAGNDAFEPTLLLDCFSTRYLESMKLSPDQFVSLGRTDPSNASEYFGMTPFAIRMSRSANGVAKKHGEVSRALWHKMFPELASDEEVPITHVTNGVHPPTWIAPLFKGLYRERIGKNWKEISRHVSAWHEVMEHITDDDIWTTHQSLKELLIAFIRQRILVQDSGTIETINEHKETEELLSPNVLTIGFARRVAAYKRWNLILHDVDRLLKMVDDPTRPVQFVFAGKAHPQDLTAKGILQELMSINNDSQWQNRAVFIDDYDQEVARYLVQGVDVWMNVPRRPLEASGTSGMKAAMNGVLNMSILDGWWIEGYNNENGFAIGDLSQDEDPDKADAEDAEALYSTLEDSVIPLYYELDEQGTPSKWITMMRDSIRTLTPQFSTDRMVREYLDRVYKLV